MAGADEQPDLFPDAGAPKGTTVVNDRCLVRTQDGHRVVIVAGVVLAQYAVGDQMAEAYAMVSLVDQGWADQNDVARAFDRSPRSLRRYARRFERGGLAALGRAGGYPSGRPRVASSRARHVRRLKAHGLPTREIARRLGVTPKAIRKLLARIGWRGPQPEQGVLPGVPPDGDPNLSPGADPHRSTDIA